MNDINERYPVTNGMWKYVKDMTIVEYLASLGADVKSYGSIFPDSFYLREGLYEPGYKVNTDSSLYNQLVSVMDNDPWNRKFKTFPIGNKVLGNEHYKYYPLMAKGLSSYGGGYYNCYIIVTTVCGEPVFCVDVLN